MTTKLRSHVGADGILTLQFPAGVKETDVDVEVTVHPVATSGFASDEQRVLWEKFVKESAGSIQDPTFFRHDQGIPEEREKLE